jgi:cysteine desulfuration protein SufE
MALSQTEKYASCRAKQERVKLLFEHCATAEKKYEKIIELGKQLPPFPEEAKTPRALVPGCQSRMHLKAELKEGRLVLWAHSDALISAGLAALLLLVYSDEAPEVILSCPPQFLEELHIHQSLSPSRSNGLASLFLKIKQEAMQAILQGRNL